VYFDRHKIKRKEIAKIQKQHNFPYAVIYCHRIKVIHPGVYDKKQDIEDEHITYPNAPLQHTTLFMTASFHLCLKNPPKV
jgi:hypothetical protein